MELGAHQASTLRTETMPSSPRVVFQDRSSLHGLSSFHDQDDEEHWPLEHFSLVPLSLLLPEHPTMPDTWA